MTIEKQLVGGTVAVLFVLLIALSMARTPGSPFDFSPSYFPQAALEEVGDPPPGAHVFNYFRWGGYLLYCCSPEIPVFIDGQTDYYGSELTEEYDEAVNGGAGWRDTFDKHDVDWVLIPVDLPLVQVLAEADDWEERFRDGTSVVFIPTR